LGAFTAVPLGPVELNAADDAGTFSMTYEVRIYETTSGAPFIEVLRATRSGSAFIFGEGLDFLLDKTLIGFGSEVRRVISFVSDDSAAPTVNQEWDGTGADARPTIPSGTITEHLPVPVGSAAGTNPYTLSVNSARVFELASKPLIVEGFLILNNRQGGIAADKRHLISMLDFDTPFTLTAAAIGWRIEIDTTWRIDIP
jgi:hypothetical protein